MVASGHQLDKIYSLEINEGELLRDENEILGRQWKESTSKDIANWSDDPNYAATSEMYFADRVNYKSEISDPARTDVPERIRLPNSDDGVITKRDIFKERTSTLFGDATYSNYLFRRYSLNTGELCFGCSKDVFPSDRIVLSQRVWHKWCVKCSQCWITLEDEREIKLIRGEIFCTRCHENFFLTHPSLAAAYLNRSLTDDNNFKRTTYTNRHNLFPSHSFDTSDYFFQNGFRNVERIRNEPDSVLINSFSRPFKKQPKSIEKHKNNLNIKSNQTQSTITKTKYFMHALNQKHLGENDESIPFDETKENENNANDHECVLVNLKKIPFHSSVNVDTGQQVYESVLDSARDKRLEKYGVPVKNHADAFETWITEHKRPSFVDHDYRVPSYDKTDGTYVIEEREVIENQRVFETAVMEDKEKIIENGSESDAAQHHGDTSGLYDGSEGTKTTKERFFESLAKDEAPIETKNSSLSINQHPSNLKGSVSSYSKVRKKTKRNVSFTSSSPREDDNNLPCVTGFRVSKRNRFYTLPCPKSQFVKKTNGLKSISTAKDATSSSSKEVKIKAENPDISSQKQTEDYTDKTVSHKQKKKHTDETDAPKQTKKQTDEKVAPKQKKKYTNETVVPKQRKKHIDAQVAPKQALESKPNATEKKKAKAPPVPVTSGEHNALSNQTAAGKNKEKMAMSSPLKGGKREDIEVFTDVKPSFSSYSSSGVPDRETIVKKVHEEEFQPKIETLRVSKKTVSNFEEIMEKNERRYKESSKKESRNFFKNFLKTKKSKNGYQVSSNHE